MIIKACIFDLDGVIVDTAKYHYIAWKSLAEQLGFNFTVDNNELLKGVSRMRSLDILLNIGSITDLSEEEKLKMAEEKNNLYVSYISNMTPSEILPGVEHFFNELRQDNIKIALGSASKNAITILNLLNLSHWFDAIVDGTQVSEAKPNPEVFLKGAEMLHVSPHECIVFEDAEAGIEAAINGGMESIGIGDPKILHKAKHCIPNFNNFNLNRLKQLFLI